MDREESTHGIVCFAVALPLRTPAVDAISLSVPLARLGADGEQRIVPALRRAADDVAAARGLLSPA